MHPHGDFSLALFNPSYFYQEHCFWPLGMETNVSKKLSIEYLMWCIHTRCFSLAFFNPCGIQFIFTKIHVENACVSHGFWPLGMETNEKK